MALKIIKKGVNVVDYTQHLESKPIVGMTTVEKKGPGQEFGMAQSETQNIHPGLFNKKNSGLSLMVEGGRTLNLGNYESARITVGLTVPCDPEELDPAYKWATEWVAEKIEEASKDAKGHS